MTEPTPTYTTGGEQLDPASRDVLVRYFEGLRSDAISIVTRSELALRNLGVPVQSAIIPKPERRHLTRIIE
jgi:hypothetical protein